MADWIRGIRLIILVTIGLKITSTNAVSCPDPCICTYYNAVVCLCRSAENVTIPRKLLDEQRALVFRVENCHSLNLLPAATEGQEGRRGNLPLQTIWFKNIRELHIGNSALSYIDRAESIIIEDIENLVVQKYWLHRANFVQYFVLRNVTLNNIPEDSMNFQYPINHFRMFNCRIDKIDSNGIVANRPNEFHIINTKIGDVESRGIQINGAELVTMESSHFIALRSKALLLDDVSNAHFRNCTFENIESHVFEEGSSVQYFEFKWNSVHQIQKRGLSGLRITKRITFSNNHVSQALEDSLIPNLHFESDDIEIDMQDNYFSCDCNIKWMFNDHLYQRLISNSTCFAPEMHYGKEMSDIEDPCNRAGQYASEWSVLVISLILLILIAFPKPEIR